MQIVSKGGNLHDMSKNKNNIIKLSSAELAQREVKVELCKLKFNQWSSEVAKLVYSLHSCPRTFYCNQANKLIKFWEWLS